MFLYNFQTSTGYFVISENHHKNDNKNKFTEYRSMEKNTFWK